MIFKITKVVIPMQDTIRSDNFPNKFWMASMLPPNKKVTNSVINRVERKSFIDSKSKVILTSNMSVEKNSTIFATVFNEKSG